ncbi:MAG: hypothetical protein WA082_04795 [Candidatus Moraniibacteriota bacterium]
MTNDQVTSYLQTYYTKLSLLERMWADPKVQLYQDKDLPADLSDHDSVFLAGPTSRHQLVEYNWRCEAVAFLREAGFDGYIFVPEPRGLEKSDDFTERSYIHWWESNRLLAAVKKAVWVPRNDDELLGLNTNFEWAYLIGRKAAGEMFPLFFGWPDGASRMGLPHHYAVERTGCHRFTNLRGLCNAVADKFSLEEESK